MWNAARKQTYSQLHPSTSLLQSPIRAPSSPSSSSSSSPEHYLYPTSHQPCRPQTLTIKITNLLLQLKQWLIELCLSENWIAEVEEQLQPIIEEIGYGHQEQQQETFCYREGINHMGSLNSWLEPRHHSILTVEHNDISLLGQHQKQLIKLYFKRYYRLFENSLARIKRYSGQKKLKFLLQTTVSNIFSQTLRVSYDLKMLQHKLKLQRQNRYQNSRNGYIYLLSRRVEMLLVERGGVRVAFERMRMGFEEGVRRDEKVVGAMVRSIGRLAGLYQRNRRGRLTRFFFTWRSCSLQSKTRQQQTLLSVSRLSMHQLFPYLSPANHSSLSQYRCRWRQAVHYHLNNLLQSMFGHQQCVFVNVEHIISNSGGGVSQMEGLEWLRGVRWEEMRDCVWSGQMCRNGDIYMVPLRTVQGIIFLSLTDSTSNSHTSAHSTPMTLRSFRILLRLVQLFSPLLQQLVNLCRRFQQQWSQISNHQYLSLLFDQVTKCEVRGQCSTWLQKIQNGSGSGMQGFILDSHRLDGPAVVISQIMSKMHLKWLLVYHQHSQSVLNPHPCIVLGQQSQQHSLKHQHIINSIYNQLIASNQNMIKISRNHRNVRVIALYDQNGKIQGMVCCQDGQCQWDIVRKCLVPFVLRNQASMECGICRVDIKVTNKNMQIVQTTQECISITLQQASQLVLASSLPQLHSTLQSLLTTHKDYLFFSQYLYRLDLSNPTLYFYLSPSLNFLNHTINHTDLYLQDNLQLTSDLCTFLHKFPLFTNYKLHLYQKECSQTFRTVIVPIKREKMVFGYWICGYWLGEDERKNQMVLEWISKIGKYVGMNKRIFRVKKINQGEISQQLREEKREVSLSSRDTMSKIGSYECKGKLYQQMQQLTSIVSSQYPKVHISIGILHSSHIQVITASNTPSKPLTPITPQLHHLLSTHSDPFSSHIKLLTEISLTNDKRNLNRTIRPLKHHQLHNSNIFLPYQEMEQIDKYQLIAKMKEMYQLHGWMPTQYAGVLDGITQEMQGRRKEVVQLGRSNSGKMYLLVVETQIDEQDDMPKQVKQQICRLYKEMVYRTNSSSAYSKTQAITTLEQHIIISKKHYIKQFMRNSTHLHHKITKFQSILSTILQSQKHKLPKYLSLLHCGLQLIKQRAAMVVQRYKYLGLRVVPLVERMQKRYLLQSGLKQIYEAVDEPCGFTVIRGCNVVDRVLSRMVKKQYRNTLDILIQYSKFRQENGKVSKVLAIQQVVQTFNKVHFKHHKLHFITQLSKLSSSLQLNLTLISQQFSKLKFTSKQSFLKYANQRFTTLFKNLDFGLTKQVSIMCGNYLNNQTVVYQIKKEKMEVVRVEGEQGYNEEVGVEGREVRGRHFIRFRCMTKNGNKSVKEVQMIRKAIVQGLVPCYYTYLIKLQQKSSLLFSLLQRITCKQLWNGSCSSQPQKIYAFNSTDRILQHQTLKMRFLSHLKSLKQSQSIKQNKIISSAINNESKNYYNLEYEYNAVSGMLMGNNGIGERQQEEVREKYGEIVTKEQLVREREEVQMMEEEEQRKSLQYQIKSKTYATSQIITFLQKRNNHSVENTSYQYLNNKENCNLGANLSSVEKAYVERKLQLSDVKDRIREEVKKEKKTAARALWLTLAQLQREQGKKSVRKCFETILLPRQSRAIIRTRK